MNWVQPEPLYNLILHNIPLFKVHVIANLYSPQHQRLVRWSSANKHSTESFLPKYHEPRMNETNH